MFVDNGEQPGAKGQTTFFLGGGRGWDVGHIYPDRQASPIRQTDRHILLGFISGLLSLNQGELTTILVWSNVDLLTYSRMNTVFSVTGSTF